MRSFLSRKRQIMIGIVDYGVGNIFSLCSSFKKIGAHAELIKEPERLAECERIILPGVGAFGDAAEKLRQTGLADVLRSLAASGKPLLGICLGMQLLFEKSYEHGEFEGLGLLSGTVRPIADVIPGELKVPHIGWNALTFTKPSPLFAHIQEGDHVYFVPSFYASECSGSVIATAESGAPLTAAVAKDNIFGCQFHPEKSGNVGLAILQAFAEL